MTRATLLRTALVVALLALAAMWIYAFSGAAARNPPDRLDDDSFRATAESICAATRTELDTLPTVSHESPPAELAATVDDAARLLDTMVGDLRAVAPDSGRDGRLVAAWLSDWAVYVGDLEEWAAELRADGEYRPFAETARGSEPLSKAMDTFANVNDMSSCSPSVTAE